MSESTPHRAEIRGDAGSGPPLVYVPGIDGSGELLLGTRPKLESHFRLVRFCYRASGPAPEGGDTYASLAASIIEGFDEAGIDRALVLAESFGGAVAVRLALDFPERVAALAIVNSFVHYEGKKSLAFTGAVLSVMPSFGYQIIRHLFAPALMLAPRRDAQATRDFRRAPLFGLDDGYLRRMKMIATVDFRDELPNLSQPVQLFASTHDRIVDSIPSSEAMAAKIPDVKLTILEKAGHVVLPLAAEPWVERMQALLARSDLAN